MEKSSATSSTISFRARNQSVKRARSASSPKARCHERMRSPTSSRWPARRSSIPTCTPKDREKSAQRYRRRHRDPDGRGYDGCFSIAQPAPRDHEYSDRNDRQPEVEEASVDARIEAGQDRGGGGHVEGRMQQRDDR